VSFTLDYTDTNIAQMEVVDIVSTARHPQVWRSPTGTPGRELATKAEG
jgi:hypothetical protein